MLLENACSASDQYFHLVFSKVMDYHNTSWVLFWINILTCWHSSVQHPLARLTSCQHSIHQVPVIHPCCSLAWQKKDPYDVWPRKYQYFFYFMVCGTKNISVIQHPLKTYNFIFPDPLFLIAHAKSMRVS